MNTHTSFSGRFLMQKKILKRKCLICGKKFSTTVFKNKKYTNGHYFSKLKIPIEGTGEYKKVGVFKFWKLKGDTVKWTGKEREVEYWECNSCYEEAMHLWWLETKIEKLFGEKCKDFDKTCIVCRAWEFYDDIRKGDEDWD